MEHDGIKLWRCPHAFLNIFISLLGAVNEQRISSLIIFLFTDPTQYMCTFTDVLKCS